MDTVAIESPALQAESDASRAVTAACSAALAEGTCAVGPTGSKRLIRATVSLEPDGRFARIVVADPGGAEALRTLRFSAGDDETERWRSIGLVIGTVAEGLRPSPEAPRGAAPRPVTPSPLAPPRSRVPPPDPPPGSALDLWLDASAVLGPALDDGTWRAGVAVSVTHSIGASPIAIGGGLRYVVRPEDDQGLEVSWLGTSAGLTARLPLAGAQFWVQPRAELVIEHVSASVEDPATGESDQASLANVGPRLAADAAWMVHADLGVWIGGELTAVQSGASIRLRRDEAARIAAFGATMQVGVRLAAF